jgi:hypothetical protein
MPETKRKLTALSLSLVLVMSATVAVAFVSSTGAQQAGNEPGNNGTVESFTVANLAAPPAVEQGDAVTVTANITNPNSFTETQEVEYRFDGAVVVREEITLEAGETTTVTYTFDSSGTEIGQSFHGVYTETRGADAPIEVVEEIQPFEVSNLTAPETATVNETVTVNATISNPNAYDDTRSVEFRFNGDLVETREVTVEEESSTTVEFELETEGVASGEYVYSVFTRDLGESGLLALEADDDGESDPPDNGDDNGDDSDDGENGDEGDNGEDGENGESDPPDNGDENGDDSNDGENGENGESDPPDNGGNSNDGENGGDSDEGAES